MNVAAGTISSETPPLATPTTEGAEPTNSPITPTSETTTEGEPKPLVEGVKPEPVTEFVPLTASDITFPEGLEINETLRDEALAVINNRELSPKEQLQGLIDLQGKLAKEASEAISDTWVKTQEEWQAAVKADPVVGGDKLQGTLSAVNKLVSEYGSPELLEVFAATGAGNNVHVIKFLHSVAGKLNEGGPVIATSPTSQETTAAERMCPSMKKG